MQKIELFYLEHCPYCVNARKALEELVKEKSAYAGVRIRWIEESVETELANSRDYYYVPTVYFEGQKLYEARPSQNYAAIKESLRGVLETVLAAEEQA